MSPINLGLQRHCLSTLKYIEFDCCLMLLINTVAYVHTYSNHVLIYCIFLMLAKYIRMYVVQITKTFNSHDNS